MGTPLTQFPALEKMGLADGYVAVNSNHIDRTLRVKPVSRKNFPASWSELGAEQLDIFQKPEATCRLRGINPGAYLVVVLQGLGQHPAHDVEALTPRCRKEHFTNNHLRANVMRAAVHD